MKPRRIGWVINLFEKLTMTDKKQVTHLDKLGQELNIDNYVVGCHCNTLYICRILKINKVMIRIQDIRHNKYDEGGWLVYPDQTVKLSGEDATAYILKYA